MTRLFPANIVLAFVWAAVTGSFTLPNLALGFALAALGLLLVRGRVGPRAALGRALRAASLALLFLGELMFSALRVARIVLSPSLPLRPGIVAFPLRVESDVEIALLANLITLTPGTLSLDVSPDRRILYVHAVDVPDPEALKRDIAAGFERRILEAFR